MVFLSANLLVRSLGPDEFWRKRKIFKLAAHFYGRRRNCYKIAIIGVQRALMFATQGRKIKKQSISELWEQRLNAGSEQHGLPVKLFKEGLTRSNILINRKTLVDLAIWEPRTFQSLTSIACARVKQDCLRNTENIQLPRNIIIKGLIE